MNCSQTSSSKRVRPSAEGTGISCHCHHSTCDPLSLAAEVENEAWRSRADCKLDATTSSKVAAPLTLLLPLLYRSPMGRGNRFILGLCAALLLLQHAEAKAFRGKDGNKIIHWMNYLPRHPTCSWISSLKRSVEL